MERTVLLDTPLYRTETVRLIIHSLSFLLSDLMNMVHSVWLMGLVVRPIYFCTGSIVSMTSLKTRKAMPSV